MSSPSFRQNVKNAACHLARNPLLLKVHPLARITILFNNSTGANVCLGFLDPGPLKFLLTCENEKRKRKGTSFQISIPCPLCHGQQLSLFVGISRATKNVKTEVYSQQHNLGSISINFSSSLASHEFSFHAFGLKSRENLLQGDKTNHAEKK